MATARHPFVFFFFVSLLGLTCPLQWFNIMTGASFFAGLIDSHGGNVLKAVAMYNGWHDGLTIVRSINTISKESIIDVKYV